MIMDAVLLHVPTWCLWLANRAIHPLAKSANPLIGLPAALLFMVFGLLSSTAFYVSIILFLIGLAKLVIR